MISKQIQNYFYILIMHKIPAICFNGILFARKISYSLSILSVEIDVLRIFASNLYYTAIFISTNINLNEHGK